MRSVFLYLTKDNMKTRIIGLVHLLETLPFSPPSGFLPCFGKIIKIPIQISCVSVAYAEMEAFKRTSLARLNKKFGKNGVPNSKSIEKSFSRQKLAAIIFYSLIILPKLISCYTEKLARRKNYHI